MMRPPPKALTRRPISRRRSRNQPFVRYTGQAYNVLGRFMALIPLVVR